MVTSMSLPHAPMTTTSDPIVYVVAVGDDVELDLRADAIVGTLTASVTLIEAPVELEITIFV